MQGSSFVHRQMIGLFALDQVLGLIGRSSDCVALELDVGRDFLANDTSDTTCFRVPMHSISNLQHRHRSGRCIARAMALAVAARCLEWL